MPEDLDSDAQAHWCELVDLLEQAGTLSPLDADALELYMALWSRWREAVAQVEDEGAVIQAANGCMQANPWYTISVGCLKDMKSFLTQFGLTPAARSKLKLPEKELVDDKWKGFE